MSYQPRVVGEELVSLLSTPGVVVLEGPKAVGKTETASRYGKRVVHMDTDESARPIAEWQIEPDLWNQVKGEVDKRGLPGKIILTGLVIPADDATRHSGAGRFSSSDLQQVTGVGHDPSIVADAGGSEGSLGHQ